MRRFFLLVSGFVAGWLGVSAGLFGTPVFGTEVESEVAEESKLAALIELEWSHRLRENPLLATWTGVHSSNHRLPSVSQTALEARANFERGLLAKLEKIDRTRLRQESRINLDILIRQLWDRVAGFDFGAHESPLLVDDGFHISFANLPQEVPLADARDYENYIARLNAFPLYVDQHIENMRRGLARGMTLPRIVLEGYEVTIESHVVDDPKKSLFYAPFQRLPKRLTDGARARLIEEGCKAILDSVVVGYRTFLRFMIDEYIPGCRTSLGASKLPDGEAYYAQRVKYFTTLDLSPKEIHELGLREVERIRGEMMEVLRKVKFKGDLGEFIEFLRTDPQFYAKTPDELLREASYIAKKMDARLPSLFEVLPRLPYGVAPVPDHLAPKYTGGRYVPPVPGSFEPGYYWVNTYALESRPLYILTALTLHEAVPGHHLQHGLALEQEQQPNFRRYDYISAYGEGWGLYSEWLGLEAGMYTDPYQDFGRLTYEMWRACRLVVDTGLHQYDWTRERVMKYLAKHTALSLHEVRTETDRYISWPAQALSYKIGELKIKELRSNAERALGPRFDKRKFHDMILRVGSVPLNVLESVAEEWLAAALTTGD